MSCKYIKNYFFIIIPLQAHLQYVYNILAKNYMDTLKALGGVDYAKYALLAITQYVQWAKIGKVKNAIIFQKLIFLSLNFF